MTDELKESFKEYAKALKKAERTARLIQDLAQDLENQLHIWEYDMMQSTGAHCIRCGDPVLGDEDSICDKCF